MVAKCKAGNRFEIDAMEVYMKIELPVVKLCWRVKWSEIENRVEHGKELIDDFD